MTGQEDIVLRSPGSHGTLSPHRLQLEPALKQARRNPWLAQNWGLLAIAAAAIITVVASAGTAVGGSRKSSGFSHVSHQTLFASIATGSSGMSHVSSNEAGSRQHRPRASATLASVRKRLLQRADDDSAVGTPIVEYETQLELFMCNPTLVSEGNDAYLVGAPQLINALSRVQGLNQDDTAEMIVTITTEPSDDTDQFYKCDEVGMLQWHATIKYPAETAALLGTTPAVMAAQANDYVAYSKNEFKNLFGAYINDEYASEPETVELLASDIVVPVVGWIVTFPEEAASTQRAAGEGSSNGIAAGVQGDYVMWAWWVWVLYALLVACCLLPICCMICKRRSEEKDLPRAQIDMTKKGRQGEGLNKIYGPEWGITELDFDADYKNYHTPEMKEEYDRANKGVKPTGYRASRPGHQSVSGAAWMQEAGKKSEWSHPSSSTNKSIGSAHSSAVRRFDIDDDADGSAARLRSKHPQYSYDMNSGGGGRARASSREMKPKN